MDQQIVVSKNAGIWDTLSAAGRMITVIATTAPAAALLLQKHDLIGLYNYFQSQPGVALSSAAVGLGTLLYGLYKSFKRGKQVASVAANPDVPSEIATTKGDGK